MNAKRLHVVIDCGNGAAALVAKEALELLGCRVTGLYCELDGRFPNHHPDPTVLENLDDLVKPSSNTRRMSASATTAMPIASAPSMSRAVCCGAIV